MLSALSREKMPGLRSSAPTAYLAFAPPARMPPLAWFIVTSIFGSPRASPLAFVRLRGRHCAGRSVSQEGDQVRALLGVPDAGVAHAGARQEAHGILEVSRPRCRPFGLQIVSDRATARLEPALQGPPSSRKCP